MSRLLYLGTMCWVVKISFSVWVWHTGWITSNNVEVSASGHASLGMPLNLNKQTHTIYSPRSQLAMQLSTDLASYQLLVDLSRLAVERFDAIAITSMTSFTDVIFNLPPAAVN